MLRESFAKYDGFLKLVLFKNVEYAPEKKINDSFYLLYSQSTFHSNNEQ